MKTPEECQRVMLLGRCSDPACGGILDTRFYYLDEAESQGRMERYCPDCGRVQLAPSGQKKRPPDGP